MTELFDAELLNEFITESREHLNTLENHLLEMESDITVIDYDTINEMFRAIHSMKGAAGFFGYKKIVSLAHIMENIFQKVRSDQLTLQEEMFDPLLEGVDILKQMIDDLENSNSFDISDLLEQLSNIAESKEIKNSEKKGESSNLIIPNLDLKGLEEVAKKIKLNPFIIKFNQNNFNSINEFKDNLNSFGEVLYSYPDIDGDEIKDQLYIIYDSMMDIDLIEAAFSINQDQYCSFDSSNLSKYLEVKTAPKEDKVVKKVKKSKKVVKPSIAKEDTIRVSLPHLNKLIDLAGELVLSRNQLIQNFSKKNIPVIQVLSQRITEMQENIISTRMQPIENLFTKFNRVVRDLSKSVDKKIDLIIDAKNVEVDNTIIEAMSDPLTHLIRNSIDHGVETPEKRVKKGKTERGTITLKAYHKGGHVIILIVDDGGGIDSSIIGKKGVENGVISEDKLLTMDNREIISLIFAPGFSTAEKITSISGRGVGMDVVKTNIEKIGGTIDVNSTINQGTTFTITIPLTLAIIPTLIVESSLERFAIPQINVVELVRLKNNEILTKIEKLGNSLLLRLREKLLPLINLRDLLELEPLYIDNNGDIKEDRRVGDIDRRLNKIFFNKGSISENNSFNYKRSNSRRDPVKTALYIVIVNVGSNQFGIIIDKIVDTEEIVVKPLNGKLKNIELFSGATITGDGKVILILDLGGIAKNSDISFKDVTRLKEFENTKKLNINKNREFFIFNFGTDEQFALSLNLIDRIEKISEKDLQKIGENYYINYKDKTIKIIDIKSKIDVDILNNENSKQLHIMIFNQNSNLYGFVFNEIIDIKNLNSEKIDKKTISGAGILGSILIDNKITIVLDIIKFLGDNIE